MIDAVGHRASVLPARYPFSGSRYQVPGGSSRITDALRTQMVRIVSPAPDRFADMTKARQTMGRRGEHVAAKWLSVHGWDIAERRFRNGRRDIDLIATRSEQAGRTVA